MRAARRALLSTSATLAASAAPPLSLADAGEKVGRDRLAHHAGRRRLGERRRDMPLHHLGRDLRLGGHRVRHELPARQPEPPPHPVGAGDGGGVVEP